MSDVREWKWEGHHVRFEPPDMLFHSVSGHTRLTDVHMFLDIYRELGSRAPFFVVVDLAAAGKLDEDARRNVSENLQTEWFAGVIYLRARLMYRAIAKGITVFLRLIGNSSVEPHFVSTEEEARALIDRLREQRSRGTELHP